VSLLSLNFIRVSKQPANESIAPKDYCIFTTGILSFFSIDFSSSRRRFKSRGIGNLTRNSRPVPEKRRWLPGSRLTTNTWLVTSGAGNLVR
jgi:hypothetical protein